MKHYIFYPLKLWIILLFLTVTVCFTGVTPIFALQSDEDIEVSLSLVMNQQHYAYVTSKDGETNYAAIKYPETILRWSVIPKSNLWGNDKFGALFFAHVDFYFGSAEQNLQANQSQLTSYNSRVLDSNPIGRFYLGIDANSIIVKSANHSLRIFTGLKMKIGILSDVNYQITNDPLGPLGCTNAVQNELLTPSNLDALKYACPDVSADDRILSFEAQLGTEWIIVDTIKLSALYIYPLDYRTISTGLTYRIHEDSRLQLGIAWVY